MIVVTGHQPVYLPWLGLFHKIAMADVFVFMDDVQYLRQDWNNRNRIKGSRGRFWLTVPVKEKASPSRLLKDIMIDCEGWSSKNHWQKSHWLSLETCYRGAPYWEYCAPFFESLYTTRPWKWLSELNEHLLLSLLDILGLSIEFIRASQHDFAGQKSGLVLDHCQRFNADICVLGAHGRDYIQEQDFREAGVSVFYQEYHHPTYPQLFGDFVPNLSVVDLLFNSGPGSRDVILGGNVKRQDIDAAALSSPEPGVLQVG